MKWEFLWLINFLLSEADHLSVHRLTSWVLFDELFVHFYCLKKNWSLLSTCVWACACRGVHVEVTGQLWGASFLLLPCEFQEGLVALTPTLWAILLPSTTRESLTIFFRPSLDILESIYGVLGGGQICSLFTPRLGFSLSVQHLPSPRSLKFQSPGNDLANHLHFFFFLFLFKSYSLT